MAHEVGAFEILERLGAGGMGEVFRARDKRLNRFVAIKFLPEAATQQARERFQREAMAIAALNHANICTLHEVGEDNGRPYLVLELLEGENLRARLRHAHTVAPEQVLEWGHAAPQYSLWAQAPVGGAFVQLPGGGQTMDGASGIAWTPAGRLVFTRTLGDKSGLWSEGSDGSGARQIAIPLESGFIVQPAVAAGGEIVFSTLSGIWRAAADGTGLTDVVQHTSGAGVLVRGGSEIIYLNHTNTSQTLWSVPLAGGTPRQVWSNKVFADGLAASPDGMRLFAFARGATADAHLAVILGLTESPPKITPLKMDFYSMQPPYGWTPDGHAITYIKNVGSVDNIWAFPLNGGKPYAITHFTELRIAAYAYSKDGRLAVSRGSDNSDAVLATGLVNKP